MPADTVERPALVGQDYAEIARWGRLLGRADARASAIGGSSNGDEFHRAGFQRSAIWGRDGRTGAPDLLLRARAWVDGVAPAVRVKARRGPSVAPQR